MLNHCNAYGIAALLACSASTGAAQTVAVRHSEGIVHGFLALRTLEGTTIAGGDLIQRARGTHVTSRLIFRFKDGSVHEETAVFSQRKNFQLLHYRLVQKGHTFPRSIDMSVDATSGAATVRYTDKDGEQKTESDTIEAAATLVNGLTLILLKNIQPGTLPGELSYVAATPKPMLVKLAVSSAGEERFTTVGLPRRATHYVVKVKIGGLKGVVASILDKTPPDTHVWILQGEAPAFVKSEGPMYLGGPIWRIELVSPVWSRNP